MDLNRITPIGWLGTAILAPRTFDEGESAKQVTSFRFAVNFSFEDHATWFTAGLEHLRVVPLAAHRIRRGEPGQSAPDHGDAGHVRPRAPAGAPPRPRPRYATAPVLPHRAPPR